MHSPEALILRRCYPVPVTFADRRAAFTLLKEIPTPSTLTLEHRGLDVSGLRGSWTAFLKEVTGAIDEVYAVIDGREVRVARIMGFTGETGRHVAIPVAYECPIGEPMRDLLDKADRDGYWQRPHEVRLELEERAVTWSEVTAAVMTGQIYLERRADR